ncbi:hypothetical protein K7432_002583 [Basidiobolus ranarum]|uniref:Cyclin n=1 Tax=Basidiobolus ranarum TaxID=34480 RepID=A0ABR2W7U3_9FUNG
MSLKSILSETYPQFSDNYQPNITWNSPVLFSQWLKPSIDWSRYDQVVEKLEVTAEEIEATVEFSGFVADMVTNLWNMRDTTQRDYMNPQEHQRRVEMISFIQGLLIFTDIPSTVVLVGMNYLYRLRTSSIVADNPPSGSEYRVLVVALLTASKYIEDLSYSNLSWSEVSGFEVEELNLMEREFLAELDWKLWISPEEYEGWLGGIDHWLAKEEWENESVSTEAELETETESELESECDEWSSTLHDWDPLDDECRKLTQLTLDQELRISNTTNRLTTPNPTTTTATK